MTWREGHALYKKRLSCLNSWLLPPDKNLPLKTSGEGKRLNENVELVVGPANLSPNNFDVSLGARVVNPTVLRDFTEEVRAFEVCLWDFERRVLGRGGIGRRGEVEDCLVV